ncbi:MAG: cytochrome c [Chloroflexi bacterium]|nr:cytochrome c [Chloroflexota bacterium]
MTRGSIYGGLLVALALLFVAMACGGGSNPSPTPRRPTTPVPAAELTPRSVTTNPAASEGGDPLVAEGRRIFTTGTTPKCADCHIIQGVTSPPAGLAPELTHVATNAATRKPGLTAEQYIRESIQNPLAFVVQGFPPIMPPDLAAKLTKAQLDALVAFLLSQK